VSQAAVELVETREFLPGQWLQTYHAPWIASAARPGQYVHVRTADHSGLVLRRPVSISSYDRAAGMVTIHFVFRRGHRLACPVAAG
jgi:NAD(P)H-flavin reductase